MGCGCPPNIPVGYDERVDGETARSIVESFEPRLLQLQWYALAGSPPPTDLTFSIEYAGGPVMVGPGGDDGCNFLSMPCDNGFFVPVAIHIQTEDGVIDGSVPAIFNGWGGNASRLYGGGVPLESFGETFASSMFERDDGQPVTLQNATVQYDDDGSARIDPVFLISGLPERGPSIEIALGLMP